MPESPRVGRPWSEARWRAAQFLAAMLLLCGVGHGAEREARCVVVEAFVRAADEGDTELLAAVERFSAARGGVVVVARFVDTVAEDRDAFEALAVSHAAAAVPAVRACGRLIHGAVEPEAAVAQLREALQIEVYVRHGCGRCAAAKAWLPSLKATYPAVEIITCDIASDRGGRESLTELVRRHRTAAASVPVFHLCDQLVVGFDRAETSGPRIEQVLAAWTRTCWVPVGVAAPTDDGVPEEDAEAVDVPWVGRLSPRQLGMPLFTLVVGLIDGFNPCAMWVLLLLLSILVNLRSRWRILAVAGTFVVVSGAAYFAFMAAWLNVFEWIGMLRPVQVALGLLAVTIGAVHVKDWCAPGRGPSLSIPAGAKPGIYDRIRAIVNAENLRAAVAGAFVLAVLVNIVELLCTAGLPAVYTAILTQRGYSITARYGYLGLYIAAYMFDDTLMVAGVTATLSRCKLQETGGRWLKFVSGVVILALGLTMLLRPDWLEG